MKLRRRRSCLHQLRLRSQLSILDWVETRAPAMVAAPAFNWSGLYLGAHVGGTFAADNVFGSNDGRSHRWRSGFGWDWQFAPTWVVGIEANYSFMTTTAGSSATVTFGPSPDALVTHGAPRCCTGRVVMLGPKYVAFFGFLGDNGGSGFTIGGGFEWMFARTGQRKSSTSITTLVM